MWYGRVVDKLAVMTGGVDQRQNRERAAIATLVMPLIAEEPKEKKAPWRPPEKGTSELTDHFKRNNLNRRERESRMIAAP
jgi:hypothetical protein